MKTLNLNHKNKPFAERAKSATLAGLLLIATSFTAQAQESDEIAELRQMLKALQSEVDTLRDQLQQVKTEASAQSEKTEAIQKSTENIRSAIRGNTNNATSMASPEKLPFKFYGYFKTDIFRDTATTAHQEIPFWNLPGSEDNPEVDVTARQTRLGVDITPPATYAGGTFAGKLETDFYGFIPTTSNVTTNHAYQLRSRHAYLKWSNAEWEILAGKTWDGITVLYPDTVNFGYYNFQGQLGLRKEQIRVTRNMKLSGDNTFSLMGSIGEPLGGVHGGDLDSDGIDDGTSTQIPQITVKGIYSSKLSNGKTALFGVSGFYSQEKIWGQNFDAYAVNFGAQLPLGDSLTLKANWWTGTDLDSVWGGIGQGVNTATREAIDATGGWVQLNYKPNAKLWFNVGYSYDDPDDADLNAGQRALNTTYLINTYYQLFAPLRLGFEYINVKTDYLEGDEVTNHRLMGSVIYSF